MSLVAPSPDQTHTHTHGHTKRLQVEVMTSVKNALVKQYAYVFGLEDVALHVSDAALRAIARQAMARQTGARGLRSILENLLKEAMFEVRIGGVWGVVWENWGWPVLCRDVHRMSM